ncbi:alpha/beta hydrolase [Nonomuraea sp. NN258]|uniref:alpha/beta fold hydrolase n=1 Tax=Nonomuraea antri TaxID=2730852 RepID=UPI00156A2CEE|nr:alpha/beta hydrolase [Nonomuraea antri]NRQ36611.1 alpha/beta hydrolase [Nonomuraea antri]
MATFVLIHGGGGSAWHWEPVERELRAHGHETVAVDLPLEDESAGLWDYADHVVEAVGERRDDLVVVAHSWGGFVAPLVAARVEVRLLVLVTAMIPAPGERPSDWWENTGHDVTFDDVREIFLHDVPADLADRVLATGRGHAEKSLQEPWPLPAWPPVPTRFVLCTLDRCFPPAFMRRVVADRLGVVPDELASGHTPMLAQPKELAELLMGYL